MVAACIVPRLDCPLRGPVRRGLNEGDGRPLLVGVTTAAAPFDGVCLPSLSSPQMTTTPSSKRDISLGQLRPTRPSLLEKTRVPLSHLVS